jgi:hypothetical protein
VPAELRDVLGDRVVEVHQPAVVEHVQHHGGDRLGRREQVEGRRRLDLPPAVEADGAVEDDAAAPAQAE